uniref:Putative secreted protein n=1 Tax=Ixodes ricinus TaxID=34613 RepID=A0A147BKT6_IXORI
MRASRHKLLALTLLCWHFVIGHFFYSRAHAVVNLLTLWLQSVALHSANPGLIPAGGGQSFSRIWQRQQRTP